jgi:hypothetical protein
MSETDTRDALLKDIVSAEKGIAIGPYQPVTVFFKHDEAANAFLAALARLPSSSPPEKLNGK